VTDDRLYQKLRKELGDDFHPVKPLGNAWKRALWIFPAAVFCLAATLAVFHLRPDHAGFHFLELWGIVAMQILVSYKILEYSLNTGIPGTIRNRFVLAGISVWSLALFIIASLIALETSPKQPAPGQEWTMGTSCLAVIGIYGFVFLLIGLSLVRSGLPIRPVTIGFMLGLSSGLSAEAVWRLHCPYSSLDHILIFHGGGIVLLTAAGFVFGLLWKRRARGRQRR
jgi:hypothetical protein